MANNKVILKKSGVQGKVPTSGDLDFGELAINYVDGKIYYKDNLSDIKSVFQDTSQVSSDHREYVGDGVEDTFNVNYSPEHVEVYLNGSLVRKSEYTATSGTSVVFNTAPANLDEISLIGYELFNLNDLTVSGVGLSYDSGTQNIASNATAINTADTIVSRDASGNFSAGTITADLAGNAATATDATRISVANEDTQNIEHPIVFVDSATGQKNLYADNSGATYNPSTNTISADLIGNAATASAWETARTLTLSGDVTGSVSIDGSSNVTLTTTVAQLEAEDVEDIVGAMFSGNTESGISLTYDDTNGNINADVDDFTITLSGDVAGSTTVTDLSNVTINSTVTGGDADTLDGLDSSQFLRSDISDTFTSLSGSSVTLGAGVTLSEATDRPDLLLIKSNTSSWGGLQISNADDDILASFMGDGSAFGIYDDQNNEWAWRYIENGNHEFSHNGALKVNVINAGLDVLGNVYLDDSLVSRTDNNSYIKFLGADDLQVVTGGTQRLEVNSSAITSSVELKTPMLINVSDSNYDTVGDDSGFSFHYMTSGATNKPSGTDHALMTQSYSAAWQTQMASDWRTNNWYVRGQNNGTWSSWDRILTTADEGAGNGLDADTVDGLHAASFLRADAADTASGLITFNGGIDLGTNNITVDTNKGFVNSGAWTRNSTPHGYIDFGPANTSYAHIYTDRPSFYFNKELYVNSNRVYNTAYHPEADTLTTPRTITLSGDVTGSTSFDGSGNVTINTSKTTSADIILTPTLTGNAFTEVAYVEGAGLASGVEMTVNGTTNSVVLAFTARIICNHSGDIVVESISGNYTQAEIRVSSNAGEDFMIEIKSLHANSPPVTVTLRALTDNAVITSPTGHTRPTNTVHTHTTYAGSAHITNTGGATAKYIVSGNTVWHAGNDGSGSGLDADTLDGAHGNTAHNDFTGNEYVRRHSSGYIYSNYYNMSANDTSTMPTQIAVETGNDGFLRWQSPSQFKANLETLGINATTADSLTNQYKNFGTISIPPSATTTSSFISDLESKGFFDYFHSVGKCSWSYAGNGDLTDTGFGTFELAGCVIETWTDNSSDTTRGNIHVRVTRPTTGAGGGQILVYNDQGSSYSPGWRMLNTNQSMYVDSAIYHTGDTNTYMQFHAADQWRVVTGGTERIEVNNNSMIVQHDLAVNGTFYEQSDEKVKENIKPLEARDLSTLKPVTYNKIDRPDTPEIGFIAQDVEKEYPELVTENEEGIKSVSYSRMTAVLLQKINEMEENYENRISSLEARIHELENQ